MLDAQIEIALFRLDVMRQLDKLPQNERYAVIHHNGLLGETPKPYREISEVLGYVGPERSRQLNKVGLWRIEQRLHLESRNLEEILELLREID